MKRLAENSVLGMRLSRERIGALVFFTLSLVYGSQIGEIHELPVDKFEAMNARSMPWFLFIVGVIGSVLLWLLGPRKEVRNEVRNEVSNEPSTIDSGSAQKSYRVENLLTAAALLLLTLAFSWLIGAIGFSASVAVFLVGGFLLLGERKPLVICTMSFGTAAVLWLILQQGFGLYLAPGTLWSSTLVMPPQAGVFAGV